MDWTVFRWVNTFQRYSGWLHSPARFYAKDGIALFAVLLLAGWWLGRRRGAEGVALAVSAGLAALVALAANQLIGHAVDRARPFAAHPGVHMLISHSADFSFPSDHSAAAGAIAVGLWLVDRRLGIVAAVAAVVMAFARVYVGAHYPGDVLGGLVVGAAAALALRPLAVRFLTPVVARLPRPLWTA